MSSIMRRRNACEPLISRQDAHRVIGESVSPQRVLPRERFSPLRAERTSSARLTRAGFDPKRTKTGLKSRSAAGSPTSWSGRARPPAPSWGPSAHLSIENERLNRYGYARQDFASLDRRVRLMQVAHGAGENSRHAGTAAPRPATEVNRHRKLLGKFK